jgi:DNA-binding transcriptional MerR regulator
MSTHIPVSNRTYSVKEASRLSGLRDSTLRYYETIGIIRPIERDASSKHRVYSQDDLNIIDAIACLNATGMPLDDMRAYLRNRNKGEEGADDEIALLQAQRQRITDEAKFLELRKQYVELKIAYWKAVKAGDKNLAESIGSKARALARTLKFPTK